MLPGRPPFQRDQDLAVMWVQVSAPPPSARQLRPELAPEVDRVIAKALVKSPDQRYATCLEFAAELRAACAITRGSPDQSATELAAAVPSPASARQPVSSPAPGNEEPITEAVRPASGGVAAATAGRAATVRDQYPVSPYVASGYGPRDSANQWQGAGYQQPSYQRTP